MLRDLLGCQRVNGRYEFMADELVKHVSAVTEDKIAACTASPVKSAEGVRRTPSPISMTAVRRAWKKSGSSAFGLKVTITASWRQSGTPTNEFRHVAGRACSSLRALPAPATTERYFPSVNHSSFAM
jgi:hypothetical protein